MARIYTRTGDDGTTGLIGNERVAKDSPVIEACGSLDEVNALLGLVRSGSLPDAVDAMLHRVQGDLFTVGAQVAAPANSGTPGLRIGDGAIERMEREIDALEERLSPLRHFILPGGSPAAAAVHLARAVARRAERRCVPLVRSGRVEPEIVRYLNRLSDLLFVLARHLNQSQSVPEPSPAPPEP